MERFTEIAPGVRVRTVDNERGTITHTLQYQFFGRWLPALGQVATVYEVPPPAVTAVTPKGT